MRIHRVYAVLTRGFRRRRMARFAATFPLSANTTILDVGGTASNWELLEARPAITLLNTHPVAAADRHSRFQYVEASGTDLDFPDASFDIAFSNSVIEHVGSRAAQRRFAAELLRVAREIWLQTPARRFFFEPHLLTPFIHFLPPRWQRRLARNFSVWGWLTRPSPDAVERMLAELNLLDAETLRGLFPGCELQRERFLGFTKAFVVVRTERE